MRRPLTIAIVARDAADTIERAVASSLTDACEILLVDDQCRDDTVSRARAVAGSRLRVIATPEPGGLPRARQQGLDAIATEFAAWLDADDEWMPGRAERLVARLEAGHDVVVDAIDLHDGPTGRWLRRLTPPSFLRGRGGTVRLFERNWLPGDTQVGFRTAVFRRTGGYDPSTVGPESYEVLLRAIVSGSSFGWSDAVGTRMFAYPDSVSRHRHRQRAALSRVLRRHDYVTVRRLYERAGHPSRVTAWALTAMALFRGEPDTALRLIDEASPRDGDPSEILEPDGPWPFREGWRRTFTRGVCFLLLGGCDEEACDALRAAEAIEPTAEGANNLGVALARLGRTMAAHDQWMIADQRFPGYADARRNAAGDRPDHVTTHPLRREPCRHEYVA